MNHSKAPFHIMRYGTDGFVVWPSEGEAEEFVAAIRPCAEAEANARLLAAAPDLLKMLVTLRNQLIEVHNETDSNLLDESHQVILRAGGQ